jgi:hypothetical protein
MLIVTLLLFGAQSANAATPRFVEFGGSKGDYFFGMTPTQDGGYAAVGYTYSNDGDMEGAEIYGDRDALLVKYDKNNQVEFISYYGGSKEDEFYDVIEDANGWLTVVGSSNSDDQDLEGLAHGGWDGIVVQFNEKGDYQTDIAIGNAGTDVLNTIVEGDAMYLVTGYSEQDESGNPAAKTATIHELDLELTGVSTYTYGGSKGDVFNRILSMEDEGSLAVGSLTSNDGDFSGQLRGVSDAIAMKIDTLGEVEWKYRYGGLGIEGFWHAIQTNDGGYLLTGISSPSDSVQHGLLVKLTIEGKLEWSKTYPLANQMQFYSAVESREGTFVVAGAIVNAASNSDSLLVKVDKKGNVISSKTFGGSKEESLLKVAKLADNTYAGVGGIGSEPDAYNALTMRFDDSLFGATVQSVKVNKTAATLKPNQSLQLSATINPSNASNKAVQWTSSNTKLATVDKNGKVRALKVGTVIITVKSIDGNKTATCKVTIKK